MKIYIPASFNPDLYQYGQQIAYLLHIIRRNYITNKSYKYGAPISIPYMYLSTIVGQAYVKGTFEEALRCMLVFSNMSFSKERKTARKYKLHNTFLQEEWIPYTITNKLIIRNYNKMVRNKLSKIDADYLPVQKHLKKFVMTADYSEINKLTRADLDGLARTLRTPYKSLVEYVDLIKDGDIFFEIGPNSGRLYTTITNIKRELRPLIKWNGKQLTYTDIANSQPLLLSSLLITITQQHNNNQPTHYTTLLFDEVRVIQKLCEDGQFYEPILEYVNKRRKRKIDRNLLKKQALQVFSAKTRDESTCIYTEYFNKHYPHMMEFIRAYKAKNGYKSIINQLQTMEADLIIHQICSELMVEYPHIPLFTVHDAIGTLPEYMPTVKEKLLAVYHRNGIHPKLKDE